MGRDPLIINLRNRVMRLEKDSHPPIDLTPAIIEILASLGYEKKVLDKEEKS